MEHVISNALLEHMECGYYFPEGAVWVESHVILNNDTLNITSGAHMNRETVYLVALREAYSFYNGVLTHESGAYGPVALTFRIHEDGYYELEEYWEPRDGSYHNGDVREKFLATVAEAALRSQEYAEVLKAENRNKAQTHFDKTGDLLNQIEKLLNEIASSPAASSNPGDYIAAHDVEYQELLSYGEFSLQYCFEQFLQGGQTDLRGHIMEIACREIAVNWGEASLMWDSEPPIEAQAWFDSFLDTAQSLAEQYSDEELEKYYPASWLLLQMT